MGRENGVDVIVEGPFEDPKYLQGGVLGKVDMEAGTDVHLACSGVPSYVSRLGIFDREVEYYVATGRHRALTEVFFMDCYNGPPNTVETAEALGASISVHDRDGKSTYDSRSGDTKSARTALIEERNRIRTSQETEDFLNTIIELERNPQTRAILSAADANWDHEREWLVREATPYLDKETANPLLCKLRILVTHQASSRQPVKGPTYGMPLGAPAALPQQGIPNVPK